MLTLTIGQLGTMLLPRPADGHKGTFGHALLIAGAWGMAGASILAGKACLRSGVGKLTMHIPHGNNDIVQTAVPEAIVSHDSAGQPVFCSPVQPVGYDAMAIGPGIGCAPPTLEALRGQLLGMGETECQFPLVMDADALNLLASDASLWPLLPRNTILTPHLGELSRLSGESVPALCGDADRTLSIVREMSERHNVVVVLKGHPSRIVSPDGREALCPWGNNGMATAGSGDVLTGIILGLLAQGHDAYAAACLGVAVHALAGDQAAQDLGLHGVVASELIRYLPKAFRAVEEWQRAH